MVWWRRILFLNRSGQTASQVPQSARNAFLYKTEDSRREGLIYTKILSCAIMRGQINSVLPSRCHIDATNIIAKKHPRARCKVFEVLHMRSLLSYDQNGNPIRFCSDCKQWLPATIEFFHKKKGDSLQNRCKECRSKKRTDYIELEYKQCHACNEIFLASEQYFPRDKANKNGFRNLCKMCANVKGREHYAKKTGKVKEKLEPGYKRCSICKEVFPETDQYFHHTKNNRSGLRSACKECTNKKNREQYANDEEIVEYTKERSRRYYRNNLEKVTARHKGYEVEHKEWRDWYSKGWYKENKEHYHKRYVENRDKILNNRKKYRQTEKGRMTHLTANHRRRARKKAAPGTLTSQQIQEKLKAQKYRCYYAACGHAKFEKKNGHYIFHLEHTVPISRTDQEPRNDINFVVLSCPTCNLSKGDKCLWEWSEGGRLV